MHCKACLLCLSGVQAAIIALLFVGFSMASLANVRCFKLLKVGCFQLMGVSRIRHAALRVMERHCAHDCQHEQVLSSMLGQREQNEAQLKLNSWLAVLPGFSTMLYTVPVPNKHTPRESLFLLPHHDGRYLNCCSSGY